MNPQRDFTFWPQPPQFPPGDFHLQSPNLNYPTSQPDCGSPQFHAVDFHHPPWDSNCPISQSDLGPPQFPAVDSYLQPWNLGPPQFPAVDSYLQPWNLNCPISQLDHGPTQSPAVDSYLQIFNLNLNDPISQPEFGPPHCHAINSYLQPRNSIYPVSRPDLGPPQSHAFNSYLQPRNSDYPISLPDLGPPQSHAADSYLQPQNSNYMPGLESQVFTSLLNTTLEELDSDVPQGNEGRMDNIRSNDDELMKLNSIPNGGIGWRKIGKILVLSKEIGKGSNGTIVLEGIYEDRLVAVKRLVRAHRAVASNEIRILIESDRHENVVRYYGVEHDQDFVYLALERCTCSLDDLIQVPSDSSNNSAYPCDPASTHDYKIEFDSVGSMMQDVNLWQADNYPSPQLVKLMRDMVLGLSHLHDLGIIHRDLKPQNVLITKNRWFGAQLSDMGISKCLLENKSSLGYHATGCGTSGWQAPEVLRSGGSQTRAIDMFSLGCILFSCITRGKHPFGENLERDHNIACDKKNLSSVEFIPEACDLISRLLNKEPKLSRPKASEVLCHPFFWSSKMRLTFLHDVSDEVELEAGKGNSDLLKELENIGQLVFDGNWIKEIDKDVMDDLHGHRRKPYDGSSVGDLLRAVRNKSNHLKHAPEKVKAILGSDPSSLDAYFAKRFPKLLIESYKVVCQNCKKDKLLAGVLSK